MKFACWDPRKSAPAPIGENEARPFSTLRKWTLMLDWRSRPNKRIFCD
jgi:hypothetical protein